MSTKTHPIEQTPISPEALEILDSRTSEALAYLVEFPVPTESRDDLTWDKVTALRNSEDGQEGAFIEISTLPDSDIRTVTLHVTHDAFSGRKYRATMVLIKGQLISLTSDYKTGTYSDGIKKTRYSEFLPSRDVIHTAYSFDELSETDKIFMSKGVEVIQDGIEKGDVKIAHNGRRIEKRVHYQIGSHLLRHESLK